MNRCEIELREWERAIARPGGPHPELEGLYCDEPEFAAALERTPLGGRLRVSDSRHGLCIEAKQHVGVVQLGPLRVRIVPKLPVTRMWTALTYALRVDKIRHLDPTHLEMTGDFADLPALMLLRESERLWRSGIQRDYREVHAWLSALRGRPDLAALARSGPLTQAALPCRYAHFGADIVDNQIILAGLELARCMTSGLVLRGALARASQQWSTVCTHVRATRSLLLEGQRGRSRLNARYAGAHRLVELLLSRELVDDPGEAGGERVPGFLWDMARLFEAFVARFMADHLSTYEVCTQHSLSQLYRVVRDRPGRRPPNPRPDLLVHGPDGATVAVLDTKYKDMWGTKIPREILYQMSVYALASEASVPVIVLYPRSELGCHDIEYGLDVHGEPRRRIILRALDWEAAISAVENRDRLEGRRLVRAWIGHDS